MNEQSKVMAATVVGAVVGAVTGYLFFTAQGQVARDRLEPLVDDLRQEVARFQRTFEKVGDMAKEGRRVVNEFQAARARSSFRPGGQAH